MHERKGTVFQNECKYFPLSGITFVTIYNYIHFHIAQIEILPSIIKYVFSEENLLLTSTNVIGKYL